MLISRLTGGSSVITLSVSPDLAGHRFDELFGGRCIMFTGDVPEITTQDLQRLTLFVNLPHGAEAEPPNHRQRWAPALNGVLEQKGCHDHRQVDPTPVGCRGQNAPGKGKGSGI